VDFSRADFRGVVSTLATFVDCDFSHARLIKLNFGGSRFIRCRFAGELREVEFADRAFESPSEALPNPMEDVDFSDATLDYVEFQKLDLERVRFPADADHLVLEDHYVCILRRAVQELAGMSCSRATAPHLLRGSLSRRLRFAASGQRRGVFSRMNLGNTEEERDFAVDLLLRAQRACAEDTHRDQHAVPPTKLRFIRANTDSEFVDAPSLFRPVVFALRDEFSFDEGLPVFDRTWGPWETDLSAGETSALHGELLLALRWLDESRDAAIYGETRVRLSDELRLLLALTERATRDRSGMHVIPV
jgi:hypothetical protein